MHIRLRSLALVVLASPVAAQTNHLSVMVDSSAVRIMARLHESPRLNAEWFTHHWRQDLKPQPQSKLDELADSLAQIAISFRTGEIGQHRADEANGAVTSLVLAGLNGARCTRNPVPDGALQGTSDSRSSGCLESNTSRHGADQYAEGAGTPESVGLFAGSRDVNGRVSLR